MQGAIATPHALATTAGARTYAVGGNAIDAALAAAATLAVVYPHQCSIGGDLFALVTNGSGRTWSVNGSGAAPAGLSASELRRQGAEMPEGGPHSITVPGVVAGWQTIQHLGAVLSLERLLEPSILAAADGIPVSGSLARGIASRAPILSHDAGMRTMFLRDGQPLPAGARLRQPALATTLERLARQGLADFYTGLIGERMAAGLARLGSRITQMDLAEHHTELGASLKLNYRGFEIETCPPNSQGFALLEALAALEACDIEVDVRAAHERQLLHALLIAAEDRDRYLGDPRRVIVPIDQILAPESLRERLGARVRSASCRAAVAATTPAHGDTVAVCAADSTGIAVSLIQSVFQTFGSGLLEPETGIVLHNRARGFSLTPGAPNEFAPRTRPAHTLMPVLIHRNRRLAAVMGTMGGRAQPQVLAQILAGVLDPRASLGDVLEAPRWVVGALDIGFERPTVAIEANAPAHLDADLKADGLDVARISVRDERVGHAQVVRVGPSGELQAASDPRSDGAAQVSSHEPARG